VKIEFRKSVQAPWLKNRPEFKTVRNSQPKNQSHLKMLLKWSMRPWVGAF